MLLCTIYVCKTELWLLSKHNAQLFLKRLCPKSTVVNLDLKIDYRLVGDKIIISLPTFLKVKRARSNWSRHDSTLSKSITCFFLESLWWCSPIWLFFHQAALKNSRIRRTVVSQGFTPCQLSWLLVIVWTITTELISPKDWDNLIILAVSLGVK